MLVRTPSNYPFVCTESGVFGWLVIVRPGEHSPTSDERWVATYTTRREAERHASRIRRALKGGE